MGSDTSEDQIYELVYFLFLSGLHFQVFGCNHDTKRFLFPISIICLKSDLKSLGMQDICLSLFFTRSALRTELPSSRLTCCLVLVVVIVSIISARKKKTVNPLDGECVPVRLNMHQCNCNDHLCLLLRTILSGFVVLEFIFWAKRPDLSGMSWKVFDTRGGKFYEKRGSVIFFSKFYSF